MKRPMLCIAVLAGLLALPLLAFGSAPPISGEAEVDMDLVQEHLDLSQQYDSGLLSVEEFAERYMGLVPGPDYNSTPPDIS